MQILNYFFFLIIYLVLCFKIRNISSQDCESRETCDQCIQELNCFWCTANQFINVSHCLSKNQLSSCSNQYIENPDIDYKIIINNFLSESQQIRPQKVKLKLRKNQNYSINFSYKQSANYPVDLYYIMDLSYSMKESKKKLGTLGKQLADEMMKKTNDFMIGFGSFVDKLTLPFVNTHPIALQNPCSGDIGCVPPYSYKNHLSLTSNANRFSERVTETQISGNLDTPEGGFDAMMQAMVCSEEIGWRPKARHLLVMSTDAVSHIAGDGKLGGVIEPNDAQCYMINNSYTKGLIYDYPSVSQINYIARQKNINIIFAIVNNKGNVADIRVSHVINHYRALSDVIENSKMGTLEKNSNNVVKFITEIYDQIRDSVRITSNATKDVNLLITSTCSSFIDGGCSSVKPGQILNFTAIIEPLECYKNPALNKKIIKIKPEGLDDSLIIELEVLCDCKCAETKQLLSVACSNQGDLECGICRCNDGRFGANCQCDKSESKGEDPSLCVKPDGKNEICSGQGKCICGKCQCKLRPDENEHIYGKYCDCDDFSCPLKCSGNGKCDCGKCICNKGWTGPGCECSTDINQCIAPGTKEICSGHGNCICGQCQCTESTERHSGIYCEECTSCPAQRCDELHACVECQVYSTGMFANKSICNEKCQSFQTEIVEKLDEKIDNQAIKKCRILVENDCTIIFQYTYDNEKNLIVTAEKHKTCPTPPNILAWIIGVVSSVILIGILTLIIWKIITTIHDKKEYAKFETERNQLRWHREENPIYKPGVSHFENPEYGRSSHRFSMKNEEKTKPVTSTETKLTEMTN